VIFADVIFPIFTLPFFWFWVPWALPLALASEAAVFWFNYRQIGSWRLLAGVLGANAFSWIIGILIGMVTIPLLPPNVGMSSDQKTSEAEYLMPYVLILFFIAFVLSTLLEYPVWKLLGKKRPFKSLLRTTFAANAVSYLILVSILIFFQKAFGIDIGF